jgi:hypothetical protein
MQFGDGILSCSLFKSWCHLITCVVSQEVRYVDHILKQKGLLQKLCGCSSGQNVVLRCFIHEKSLNVLVEEWHGSSH